ncbi:MAG: hypothetical protein N2558_03245 [Patescibacteria group bacterium]|nr:hypothetical protein [Patescibacteria group bacterium]
MLKPKPPKVVVLIFLTTITTIFWVFYTVYSIMTKNLPINIPQEMLNTVNPNLDLETLNSIQEKIFYDKEQLSS